MPARARNYTTKVIKTLDMLKLIGRDYVQYLSNKICPRDYVVGWGIMSGRCSRGFCPFSLTLDCCC